jgi:hypothetical protein
MDANSARLSAKVPLFDKGQLAEQSSDRKLIVKGKINFSQILLVGSLPAPNYTGLKQSMF